MFFNKKNIQTGGSDNLSSINNHFIFEKYNKIKLLFFLIQIYIKQIIFIMLIIVFY